MDCEVFIGDLDPEAYKWAQAHLTALLKQQHRHPDGRICSRGETVYSFDEQLAAASEAEMSARLAPVERP